MDKWSTLVTSKDVGLSFSIVCDRGFAVGLCTHRHAAMGPLVWMAEPFFEDFPTVDDVISIESWRWPIFFPLGAALRRKIVERVGRVPIPAELVAFPIMRSGGSKDQPWMEKRGGALGGPGQTTENRNLPIVQIVNDTMLKEMLITGWKPADRW